MYTGKTCAQSGDVNGDKRGDEYRYSLFITRIERQRAVVNLWLSDRVDTTSQGLRHQFGKAVTRTYQSVT